jgi:hypothetical protein
MSKHIADRMSTTKIRRMVQHMHINGLLRRVRTRRRDTATVPYVVPLASMLIIEVIRCNRRTCALNYYGLQTHLYVCEVYGCLVEDQCWCGSSATVHPLASRVSANVAGSGRRALPWQMYLAYGSLHCALHTPLSNSRRRRGTATLSLLFTEG